MNSSAALLNASMKMGRYVMSEERIGQYRILGEAQKHRFGQTLTVSSLEDKEQFFLYKFPALIALASQRSCCENLITQWNETLHTSMSSGHEHNAEATLPRLEIIENSLVSIHPFVEGVWLNSMPPLLMYHALQVFQQVGREVVSIHERGWVHGMLEADHILIDGAGEAHLITPPLSWLDEILEAESREELFEEGPHFGTASVSTDVSDLLSLVYHLFASSDSRELMSGPLELRENLREGIPLQLEMVLVQLSDASQRDSIRSVRQLMDLISGCFSPRMKRRGSRSTLLREEDTCDARGHESPKNCREESQVPCKKRGRLMSQSLLFINCIERLFAKARVHFEGLVDLRTKYVAQWVSFMPFLSPLRAGALSVGLCSFIISVSLLVSQGSHQVAEPANPDWQGNTSDRSSDTKDKRKDYVLTEPPLPKFFEEYGSDEYGGYIE